LPGHYAKTWLEKEDLRALREDKFRWVSKFYLATRQESARRRAVHQFIQDIMQTIEEACALRVLVWLSQKRFVSGVLC